MVGAIRTYVPLQIEVVECCGHHTPLGGLLTVVMNRCAWDELELGSEFIGVYLLKSTLLGSPMYHPVDHTDGNQTFVRGQGTVRSVLTVSAFHQRGANRFVTVRPSEKAEPQRRNFGVGCVSAVMRFSSIDSTESK